MTKAAWLAGSVLLAGLAAWGSAAATDPEPSISLGSGVTASRVFFVKASQCRPIHCREGGALISVPSTSGRKVLYYCDGLEWHALSTVDALVSICIPDIAP